MEDKKPPYDVVNITLLKSFRNCLKWIQKKLESLKFLAHTDKNGKHVYTKLVETLFAFEGNFSFTFVSFTTKTARRTPSKEDNSKDCHK